MNYIELPINDEYENCLNATEKLLQKEDLSSEDLKVAAKYLYCAIGKYVLAVVSALNKEGKLELSERIEAELPIDDNTVPSKQLDEKLARWINKLYLFDKKDRQTIVNFINQASFYGTKTDKLDVKCYYYKIKDILDVSKLRIRDNDDMSVKFEFTLDGFNNFLKTYKETITIITAIVTAIGASNSIPYWYNVGYLEYWGLSTSVLEPARNTSVSNRVSFSIFVTLAILSFFTLLALFLKQLDCVVNSTIRSVLIIIFELIGSFLIENLVLNNISGIKILNLTIPMILLRVSICVIVVLLTYYLKNYLFNKEIRQFSLSRQTPVEIESSPLLFKAIFILIISSLVTFLPFGFQKLGNDEAKNLRTAKIIKYKNQDYMVVASDNSLFAIEKVVEHNGKELYVYTNDVLLLDSDKIKEITLKTYKDIKIEE